MHRRFPDPHYRCDCGDWFFTRVGRWLHRLAWGPMP